MARAWKNWGRTQSCRPQAIARPSSEDEIRQLVGDARKRWGRLKVVGAGHSFTDIACTDGVHVSLDDYNNVLDVDRRNNRVTVQAGIRLRELNEALAREGLAMSNLGDIAYQSIAGAISTGTHGTGRTFGNIATFVREITMVLADGSGLRCAPDADDDVFKAAQISLGALGVLSTVTLQCEPAFSLRAVEDAKKLDDVLGGLDELFDTNEHFEFYWFPHTSRAWTKQNNRTTDPPTKRRPWKEFQNDIVMSNVAFGAICRMGRRRPDRIPDLMKRLVAPGVGRIRRVSRSDLVYTSPRLVRFAEMEYAIPRQHAREAIEGVKKVIESNDFKVNFPIEVRVVAPDDILLSPAHGRETCYIAVHLYQGMDHEPYFRAVEELMMGFDGRPHWGKLHYRDAASLRQTYPRFDDFVAVRDALDPTGLFRNAYLDRVLGPGTSAPSA
jgi:L-gulono-1,4-lactone dehydrogenase